MDAYDVRMLPEEEQVILVVSTTGQVCLHILKDPAPRMNACQKIHGKPVQSLHTSPKHMESMRGTPLCVVQGELPSNMRAFWRFLLRKNLPADSLSGLSFAAFGLGDSGKPFCMPHHLRSLAESLQCIGGNDVYLILSDTVLAQHTA